MTHATVGPMRVIQCMETAHGWDDAYAMLRGLADQWGYLGGRVLPPSPNKPGWRVQVFVEDAPHAADMWLPDGCRRVILPQGLARQLGIEEG